MEKSSLPLAGGCRCGALRYEVAAAPLWVTNCHCTNCQKISGSAFAVNAIVAEPAFRFVSGSPSRDEWKSDIGTDRFGWFCGDCGSRIAHGQTPSSGFLSLRTGSLDDAGWVEPVADIWVRSAQPWIRFDGARLEFEKQPADYSGHITRFKAQERF